MPTLNQKKVIDIIRKQVAKGGKVSVTKAMREAGVYTPMTARHPEKITKSKGYIKLMEEAGLTDKFLANKQAQLINSTRLEKDSFHAEPKIEIKRKKEKIVGWVNMSDDKIKLLVEGTPEAPTGNKIAYIKRYEKHKEVFFRIPDNVVQSKALEMGLKIKDHFAPDKLDIIEHDLAPDEQIALDLLFGTK